MMLTLHDTCKHEGKTNTRAYLVNVCTLLVNHSSAVCTYIYMYMYNSSMYIRHHDCTMCTCMYVGIAMKKCKILRFGTCVRARIQVSIVVQLLFPGYTCSRTIQAE